MKITGVRSEQLPDRPRGPARGPAAIVSSTPMDSAGFLGLTPAELTGPVQKALQTLLSELDALRSEVARLKAQLAEAEGLADRDVLTPALNRRAFMRELHRARAFRERYGSPASLVYFDLAGFKAVNDRFGHAAGDAALKAVAERLMANLRTSDVVGRMGGDEFAVILVQADAATAQVKAEALTRAVEATPIEFGEWSAPIHLSFGVHEIAADADPEAVVAAADAAMYARRRQTRP
jgi:diguanylate cyclase (GGDEF)-like protein